MAQAKSVDELERDVEQARARVAADIALIRSPETYESAKNGLMSSVFGYRDEITDKARAHATSFSDGLIESLKAKASANPLAVAAIGAGIAWRLYKHPPVMTVLVGLGLASLLRTDPNDDSMHPRRLMEVATDKALEYKDRAVAQVQELRESAIGAIGEKVHDAAVVAEGAYEGAKERALELASSVRESAVSAMAPITSASPNRDRVPARGVVGPQAGPSRGLSQSGSQGGDMRDAYLLGVAALAVGAAIGLARRDVSGERSYEESREYDDIREGRDAKWRRYS